jgi:hypothetical protein
MCHAAKVLLDDIWKKLFAVAYTAKGPGLSLCPRAGAA